MKEGCQNFLLLTVICKLQCCGTSGSCRWVPVDSEVGDAWYYLLQPAARLVPIRRAPLPRQQVPFARYLRHSRIPHLLLPLTKWQELSREALGVFTTGYLGAVFTSALFTEKSGHLPAAHEKNQCTNGWVSMRDLAHHSELEIRVTCLDKRQ